VAALTVSCIDLARFAQTNRTAGTNGKGEKCDLR
jgi:hypothetical protein